MKFQTILARCVLRLCGIDWRDLDQVFKDAMSFAWAPIMLGFTLDKANWALVNMKIIERK